MKDRLQRLLLQLLFALSIITVDNIGYVYGSAAFYRSVSSSGSILRNNKKLLTDNSSTSSSSIINTGSSSSSSSSNTYQSYRATTTTTTLNSASLKFKNFDMMLDAFREEPVMVYFTSLTCGPCKLQKKELTNVHKQMMGSFKILTIDAEKWPHVGSRYSVGKLPCLLFMKDKQVLLRLEGLTKADDVIKYVREAKVYSIRE